MIGNRHSDALVIPMPPVQPFNNLRIAGISHVEEIVLTIKLMHRRIMCAHPIPEILTANRQGNIHKFIRTKWIY